MLDNGTKPFAETPDSDSGHIDQQADTSAVPFGLTLFDQ